LNPAGCSVVMHRLDKMQLLSRFIGRESGQAAQCCECGRGGTYKTWGVAQALKATYLSKRASHCPAATRQGRPAENWDLLAPVYGWLSGALDTFERKEARACSTS
jgi:hypothetical protein